jgi:small-conductance mechanosensitive channel
MEDLLSFAPEATRPLLSHVVRLAAIVLTVLVANFAVRSAARALEQRLSADVERSRRAHTLARVARYVTSVTSFVVGTMLVLAELGVAIEPLVATAGVAGVALGLGAQSIVRDYLGGVYLLVEDQLRVGEVVRLGAHAGLVEEVTLRHVRLRDTDGTVYFVPNGEIKVVENLTRTHAHAVIDVAVSYEADVDRALRVLQQTLEGATKDAELGPLVSEPEVLGVQELGDSAIVVRGRLKVVPPLERWNVKRKLLRRVKLDLEAEGIEIPLPQLVVRGPARAPTPETKTTA